MKINNPLQISSRSKLEKEIEDYKSGIFKDPTLSARIKEHNIKYKDDVEVVGGNMFDGCTTFNQPLAGWDISNINFMNMFQNLK